MSSQELPIIQKTYDLIIKWYVPILNRLPKNHKFILGTRITNNLYDIRAGLIRARYAKEKLAQLESSLMPKMSVTISENKTKSGKLSRIIERLLDF